MSYCLNGSDVSAGSSTIRASNESLPASNSQCSLSHEVDLVEPAERISDEQSSLHIYLKAEMAKVFEVLKLSVPLLTSPCYYC